MMGRSGQRLDNRRVESPHARETTLNIKHSNTIHSILIKRFQDLKKPKEIV